MARLRLRPRVVLISIALIAGAASRATATTISAGVRIPISPTTFALPIEITGAVSVSSWHVDLLYDPADVQVNTACDPFSGDIYCSLVTSYVTEGNFFAAGAPFNLLTQGFVNLDPSTLAQTGLLFDVNGAYGGSPPSPSGGGTLAFVEFTLLGRGDTPITVIGTAASDTPVPEPGTLALVAAGLLAPRLRRARRP
jgi:PEP-CTERM motif